MSKPINYYLSQPISDSLSDRVDSMTKEQLIDFAKDLLESRKHCIKRGFVSLPLYNTTIQNALQLAYGCLAKAI
jgi:hypothetical protein